jgi:hypothetical protein
VGQLPVRESTHPQGLARYLIPVWVERVAEVWLVELAGLEVEVPRTPALREHTGQALQPWAARTRLATAICSARLALAGLPDPPKACQVLGVNCNPPE